VANRWTNWSGVVECAPEVIAVPRDEADVIATVRAAIRDGLKIRATGAGHSHAPLCKNDGALISLDRLLGVRSVDTARGRATIGAGTRITALGEPLLEHGLALANQGDIDVQALAGAISTGTHGTGPTLGSLSTMVRGLRLIDGRGDLIDIDETTPALLRTASVAMGSVGVILSITLQLVPAYRLHERLWSAPLEQTMDRLDMLIAATRHFEFFMWPETGMCNCKALQATNLPPDPLPHVERQRIDHSYRVFPSVRQVKHVESEWSVPAEKGPDCFREIHALMTSKYPHVRMPVEYRTVAADNLLLSPNYGRASVTISIHEFVDRDWLTFFADAQSIFLNHEGRPHWGKWHSLRALDIANLYPGFNAFHAARRALDPAGVFLSPYMTGLFG
jgi:FAD/FMN-containing dehydrogenase